MCVELEFHSGVNRKNSPTYKERGSGPDKKHRLSLMLESLLRRGDKGFFFWEKIGSRQTQSLKVSRCNFFTCKKVDGAWHMSSFYPNSYLCWNVLDMHEDWTNSQIPQITLICVSG